MNETERAVLLLSRLMPFEPPVRLKAFFAPRLEGAALLIPPASFAKSFLVVSALALAGGLAAVPLAAAPVLFLLLASLLALEVFPILLLGYLAQSRRRSTEGELPFFAMLLFILSHQSSANLPGAFERADHLGTEVFPAISSESGRLGRNLAYSNEPEHAVVEKTFRFHPSKYLKEMVHGYQVSLSAGRDVREFAGEEADRLLAVQEDRWRSFSIDLSSMTEVSFIFLAIFPVGMQMVAGSFSVGGSSALLILSTMLLALVAVVLLVWMDSSQPVSKDTTFPGRYLGAVVLASSTVLFLRYLGVLTSAEAAGSLLGISLVYVGRSVSFFRKLEAGEDEVPGMLHDLAELARSGVDLPRALSMLLEDSESIESLRDSLATFAQLMSLGRGPVAAQRNLAHPSWLVRVSFALLAIAFESGAGYEQLERLSSSFRRVSDSRRSVRASVLPFAALGVAVPALSAASFWFLRSMLALSPGFQLLTLGKEGAGAGVSILACTVLTGLLVSKAYSQSVRNAVGLPLLLASALVSLIVFGGP